MSYTDYLKELLRPLGVYDVEAPFNGGELAAAGEALDGALGALAEVERESSLVTARSWGLEGVAKLLLHRPAAETEEGLSQALAALLPVLEAQADWNRDAIFEACKTLAEQMEKKNGWLLFPLGIALSGKARTPGGGTDLAAMMGKEETIVRVKAALEKL